MECQVIDLSLIRELARSGAARQIRENALLSLADLAKALGVHPSSVSRWETGRSLPRAGVAGRWGAILRELNRSDLVGRR
jgi:transcriptional regulator with XRE-family HTH domain